MWMPLSADWDRDLLRDLAAERGTPLLVINCDLVRRQYRQLQNALPQVKIHYAIKALPELAVIDCLDALGAHFDVATSGEIGLLRQLHLNPRRTIHTHPIKRDQDIRTALRFGCTTFVVDNAVELNKLIRYKNRVGLLLRLSIRSSDAVVDLSKKFGCAVEEALPLLSLAQKNELTIKGLCVHVGSQCSHPSAHVHAIETAIDLIFAARKLGIYLTVLDIGGGFPADYGQGIASIEDYCAPIRQALAQLPTEIEVFAEPGRALVASAAVGLTKVIGYAQRQGTHWYYLDDGVYGNFSGQLFDHARYPLDNLSRQLNDDEENGVFATTFAGPTCDSIDVIAESVMFPKTQVGDVLVGQSMGAYTLATSTEFNSLPRPTVVILNPTVSQRRVSFIS